METLYLCDGGRKCNKSLSCLLNPSAFMGVCQHTTDENHALNGICDHPEEYPGRFEEIKSGNRIIYCERTQEG